MMLIWIHHLILFSKLFRPSRYFFYNNKGNNNINADDVRIKGNKQKIKNSIEYREEDDFELEELEDVEGEELEIL